MRQEFAKLSVLHGQHGPKNQMLPTSVSKHTTEFRLLRCVFFLVPLLVISCWEAPGKPRSLQVMPRGQSSISYWMDPPLGSPMAS